MKQFYRVIAQFKKQGIELSYQDGIYSVQDHQSQATILLPEQFELEGKAVQQLLQFAGIKNPQNQSLVRAACATPDFHPGSTVPVGSVVATDLDCVIPSAIGTDINCGMRIIKTGITKEWAGQHRELLIQRLRGALLEGKRDLPLMGKHFELLFSHSLSDLIQELPNKGLWNTVNRHQLIEEMKTCVALSSFQGDLRYAPEALLANREIRDPCLGTPGSGNHFVEFQWVDKILDRHQAYAMGLKQGELVVMIHSGSRDVGFFVGQRWMDRAKAEWPQGVTHPKSGLYALEGVLAQDYLKAMGVAARYAWWNRVVLGEMVRQELETVLGSLQFECIADVPHNVILQEGDWNIHRKGSTPAHQGQPVIIPGSMGTSSFIAQGLGNEEWLHSCSHGAGRKVRRQDVRRQALSSEVKTWECITLREERLREEAPEAYKSIGPVIKTQEEHGLIKAIVELKPWLTWKA